MRISDWSSDVCSSDLAARAGRVLCRSVRRLLHRRGPGGAPVSQSRRARQRPRAARRRALQPRRVRAHLERGAAVRPGADHGDPLADAAVPGRAARIRGSPGLPAGAAPPARRPGGQSAAAGELPDPANRTAGDAMNPLARLSSFYYPTPGLTWLSRLPKPARQTVVEGKRV